MQVRLRDIPQAGLDLAIKRPVTWLHERFAENDELRALLSGSVELKGSLAIHGNAFFLNGALTTDLRPDCDRCLKTFTLPLEGDISYMVLPASERGDNIFAEPESTYFCQAEDILDLQQLIAEEIALLVPALYLCDEACKGLCQHCGQNQNEEPCACAETIPATGFGSVLAASLGGQRASSKKEKV